MDEKQIQFLFDNYAKGKGFKDINEFRSLMGDEGSRKIFFDDSNKELGFKDYNDFEETIGVKKKPSSNNGATPLEAGSSVTPNLETEIPLKIAQDFTGIPDYVFNVKGLSKPEFLEKYKSNKPQYERNIATAKAQSALRDELYKLPNGRQLWADVVSSYNAAYVGDAAQQRENLRRIVSVANSYGGEKSDEIVKNLGIDFSNLYGKESLDVANIEKDPKSAVLNNIQLGAWHLLEDTKPNVLNKYKAALLDDKDIKDNLEAKLQKQEAGRQLELLGATLQKSYAQEKLNPILKEYNNLLDKDNLYGLSPEEQVRKVQLEHDGKPFADIIQQVFDNESTQTSRYPMSSYLDANNFAQELVGQKHTGLGWLAAETGKATENTAKGIWDIVSEPFRSDENSNLHQAEILGSSNLSQNSAYLKQENQLQKSFKPELSEELQKDIDAIKNDPSLSDSQKLSKASDLLMSRAGEWRRSPVENGETNIGLTSLMYGVGGLAANLAPFVLGDLVTGGVVNAGALKRFSSMFTSAAATSFHDAYVDALKRGEENPFAHAARVTAINSAALAGADAPAAIRKMIGGETAIGKLVSKMTDDEIAAALKESPKALTAFGKSLDAIKKTGGQIANTSLQSFKSGAKIAGITTAGQAVNDAIDKELKSPIDYAKQAAIETLKFGVGGTMAGIAGRAISKPTEMNLAAISEAGKNPEPFLMSLETMEKNGSISPEQAQQVRTNIEKANKIFKSSPILNNPDITDKVKREYLYNTWAKKDIQESMAELPPKMAEKAEMEAMVLDHKNELLLHPPTDKQLGSQQSALEKKLEPKKDAEGKSIELPEKEKASLEAELEAVKQTIEARQKEVPETKTEEVKSSTTVSSEEVGSGVGGDVKELNSLGADIAFDKPQRKDYGDGEKGDLEYANANIEHNKKVDEIIGGLTQEGTLRDNQGGEYLVTITSQGVRVVNKMPDGTEGSDISYRKGKRITANTPFTNGFSFKPKEQSIPTQEVKMEQPTVSEKNKTIPKETAASTVPVDNNMEKVNRLIFDRETGQPLDGSDETMAEQLIEKAISKSKDTDQANAKLDQLGYNLRGQANADFNQFVQDRIDGKTDMTFSEWKNQSENKPIPKETAASTVPVDNNMEKVNRLIFDRETGQPLDGSDETMAEQLIEKAISKSKDTDQANAKLDQLGYNLRGQANADFNQFVQDRIDGKTDMTFSEWKNQSENKPIQNEPIKEALSTTVSSEGVSGSALKDVGMPKEISDLYSEAASLRFTINALKMQMGGKDLVGKAKTEYENTKARLDNIELKLSEYEQSKNKDKSKIEEVKKEKRAEEKQTFEAGEEANYYDDLFDKTDKVKILYKTGDGENGTERYQVQFENGQEASIWSDKLQPIKAKAPTQYTEAATPKPTVSSVEEGSVGAGEDVGVKEGFTDGKHLNKMFNDLKGKYGDKKGSAIYEAANRLVNPNENAIVEIRGNGVVVKEGGKYILKPFGNTDANIKKWTLYKGMDISDQFPTENKPIQNEPIKEGVESNEPITSKESIPTEASPVESSSEAKSGEGGGGKKPPVDTKQLFGEGEEAGKNKKEFDKMTSSIPNSGEVKKYLSGDTIKKYEKDSEGNPVELRNNQEITAQELEPALKHGLDTIEKAKEVFGDDYVNKTLDYIEAENLSPENKALLYVSLENEIAKRLQSDPQNVGLKKLQDLVREKSQAYLRSNSLAINMGRLRKFAETGYDITKVTDRFFSPKEVEQKSAVEKLVQADAETIQKESEEQVQKMSAEGMTPEIEKLVNEGVEKEINKIYDKLPKDKKRGIDKAIAALEKFQKSYKGKAYDATGAIPLAIVDAGITAIKLGLKAGAKIADAIELGVNKIKEKWGKEWEKEADFRKDMAELFKEEEKLIEPKEFTKKALIQQGFGKQINVKTKEGVEKREVLDWKKLAGEEGSVDKISANVAKSLATTAMSAEQINAMSDAFIKEYTDLRASVVEKGLNEIAARNKTVVTPDQKSAAKKLAEMYNYGLFDKDLAEYQTVLAKTIGVDKLNPERLKEVIQLGDAMSKLMSSKFQGKQLTETELRTAVQRIEELMRSILNAEANEHGSTALKLADGVQTYMDLAQRMTLNSLKQAAENPLSGKLEDLFNTIGYAGSIPKVLNKDASKMARQIYKEMVLEKGSGYGNIQSTFVNRGNVEMMVDKMSDNQVVQGIMSTAIGKTTLDAVDSMFKMKITQQKFVYNLIQVLTKDRMIDGKVQKGMSKQEAQNYVAEKLTGQSFKEAQQTAKDIIANINESAGKKIFNDSPLFVDRLAHDIVTAALVNGEKISADMVKASYNAAYKAAGRGLGHVANNIISRQVGSVTGELESRYKEQVKDKDYRSAALTRLEAMFFRNIANPFVGGGSNWVVLKAEKSGLGLLSGVASMYKYRNSSKIDLTSEAGSKNLENAMYQQMKVRDKLIRGAVGGAATALTGLALLGIVSTDKYRKWRNNNMWAAKYADLITPEILLASMAKDDGKIQKYIENSVNKNEQMDKGVKAIKVVKSAITGDKKTAAQTGELLGSTIGSPVPWRLVRDGDQLWTGITGGEPYKVNSDKPETFVQGYLKAGMLDYMGYAPHPESVLSKESKDLLQKNEIKIKEPDKTYVKDGVEVEMTDKEFKEFTDRRDERIQDALRQLKKNGVNEGGNEKDAIKEAISEATETAKQELFGFGQKTPENPSFIKGYKPMPFQKKND